MTTNRIGGTLVMEDFVVVQGNNGAYLVTVTFEAGHEPGSYDGWLCTIVFVSPFTNANAITLTPSVTGDSGTKTLSAQMTFVPGTTSSLAPGVYPGNVKMTHPDSSEQYIWIKTSLTIEAQT